MAKEYLNFRHSARALAGMPIDRLYALHTQVESVNANVSSGSHLKEYKKKLERAIKLEEKRQKNTIKEEVSEYLHEVFSPPGETFSMKGMLIEAHPDDHKMFNLSALLGRENVGLTVVTFTDGSARGLKDYKPDELAAKRWEESKTANTLLRTVQVFNRKLPDSLLYEHQDTAKQFLQEIKEEVEPDFIVAPNLLDRHFDHATAGELALEVAKDSTPLYFMDTIAGFDLKGNPIEPTEYYRLSMRAARREKKAYKVNESQVFNLPTYERREVNEVLAMTKRRGAEKGVNHAGVVVFDKNTKDNPVYEVLRGSYLK